MINVPDLLRNAFTDTLPQFKGDLGLPWVGVAHTFLANPLKLIDDFAHKYGDFFKVRVFGEVVILVADADAAKEILADKKHIYSSRQGWDFVMGELFKDGLLLRDGQDHKFHRELLQQAFLKAPMAGYLGIMNPIAHSYFSDNPIESGKETYVFSTVKELTLKMAGAVFFGVELDNNIGTINKAISDIVYGVSGIVRLPLPFTLYGAGFAGRLHLLNYFRKLIPSRRVEPTNDLFGQLCALEDNGRKLTEMEIVNHAIFILMAAHDTTASSITSLIYELGKNPEWQTKLRQESQEFYSQGELSYDRLKELKLLGYAFRETLRLHPPLVAYPRKLTADTTLKGYSLTRGTRVAVISHLIQRDSKWWPDPLKFKPNRFSPEIAEHKNHSHAFIPFGAGKHLCLGLNFAEMQAKLIMSKLLCQYQWQLPENYQIEYEVPLQEPKDGLPVRFEKVKRLSETNK